MSRLSDATAHYKLGLERVATTPYPEGQKFAPGSRVRITDDLGYSMEHFPGAGKLATVKYTHAHAYRSTSVKSYCLDIDDYGEVSWYSEHQLTAA